jgi:hypothetical protein
VGHFRGATSYRAAPEVVLDPFCRKKPILPTSKQVRILIALTSTVLAGNLD